MQTNIFLLFNFQTIKNYSFFRLIFELRYIPGNEVYDVTTPLSNFSFVELHGQTPAKLELVFAARKIPPMGYKMYYVEKINKRSRQIDVGVSERTKFKYGTEVSSHLNEF